MPRALSSDLRIRVIRFYEEGASARGAGRQLGIGESTATALVGRWRQTGSIEPISQKGRSRSPLKAHEEWLLSVVVEQPDVTLLELCELLTARGVVTGTSSVSRFFARHGISFKKNRARRRAGAAGRSRGAPALEGATAGA